MEKITINDKFVGGEYALLSDADLRLVEEHQPEYIFFGGRFFRPSVLALKLTPAGEGMYSPDMMDGEYTKVLRLSAACKGIGTEQTVLCFDPEVIVERDGFYPEISFQKIVGPRPKEVTIRTTSQKAKIPTDQWGNPLDGEELE